MIMLFQLLYFRSQKNIYIFPVSFSFYLYACGCSKRIMMSLQRMGFSVSYTTLIKYLKKHTDESITGARELITNSKVGYINFAVMYDNVQFPLKKGQQTLTDADQFTNCTSSF